MRKRVLIRVDLPQPVRPTMPIFSRGLMLRLKPFSTRSRSSLYRTYSSQQIRWSDGQPPVLEAVEGALCDGQQQHEDGQNVEGPPCPCIYPLADAWLSLLAAAVHAVVWRRCVHWGQLGGLDGWGKGDGWETVEGQQETKYTDMRKGNCTPALMTDAASFHDNYPVSCWQILHLVGGQDASPASQQATNTSLEDVGPYMSIHCAKGVVQQGDGNPPQRFHEALLDENDDDDALVHNVDCEAVVPYQGLQGVQGLLACQLSQSANLAINSTDKQWQVHQVPGHKKERPREALDSRQALKADLHEALHAAQRNPAIDELHEVPWQHGDGKPQQVEQRQRWEGYSRGACKEGDEGGHSPLKGRVWSQQGSAAHLKGRVPQGVNVHWHHPDLAGIIALQVHHCANTPGVTHIHTQA
ncbi:MAG: hypothetical protein FRX49_03845 [Trebouxia sp. A1-2]|nr:MAG: hypothetical protein FRX49_03845 [Trebouxia sp. A1-2]